MTSMPSRVEVRWLTSTYRSAHTAQPTNSRPSPEVPALQPDHLEANARRAPAAARCKLPGRPKAHWLGGRLAHNFKKGRPYELRHHRSIWQTRSFDRRTG